MTLPASATKVYLDAATDDPKQARPELADLVDKFNDLLTHLNLSTITSGPAAIPLSVANGGTGSATAAGARTALGVEDATETQAGRIEIATQTETNNGTDDARALTPAKLANISPSSVTLDATNDRVLILDASDSNKLKRALLSSLAFQTSYTSAQQTITLGGGLTLAHGLGGKPRLIRPYFVCQTAEFGWAVNDEMDVNRAFEQGGSLTAYNVQVWGDSTNVNVRYGATGMIGGNKTTGASAVLTTANWRLVVEAYR